MSDLELPELFARRFERESLRSDQIRLVQERDRAVALRVLAEAWKAVIDAPPGSATCEIVDLMEKYRGSD